jgi:hypothetical protein
MNRILFQSRALLHPEIDNTILAQSKVGVDEAHMLLLALFSENVVHLKKNSSFSLYCLSGIERLRLTNLRTFLFVILLGTLLCRPLFLGRFLGGFFWLYFFP